MRSSTGCSPGITRVLAARQQRNQWHPPLCGLLKTPKYRRRICTGAIIFCNAANGLANASLSLMPWLPAWSFLQSLAGVRAGLLPQIIENSLRRDAQISRGLRIVEFDRPAVRVAYDCPQPPGSLLRPTYDHHPDFPQAWTTPANFSTANPTRVVVSAMSPSGRGYTSRMASPICPT
jgi:hypothetical protein